MIKDVFTSIEDFNTNDFSVRGVVYRHVFGEPLRGNLEFAFSESDVGRVCLRVIGNFHIVLLKVKRVYCYYNNCLILFFGYCKRLFNMIKISTPFGVILKILAKRCSAMLSREMLSMKDGFFYFIESCAALSHLLLGMAGEDYFHQGINIAYGDGVVKQDYLNGQKSRPGLNLAYNFEQSREDKRSQS